MSQDLGVPYSFCLEVTMRETGKAGYKAQLIPRIIQRFGAHRTRVTHNDPNLPGQQGIPDLTVYVGDRYMLLEVKASEKSSKRPNQEWWLEKWSAQTFTSLIYPENEEEVLDAMELALRS